MCFSAPTPKVPAPPPVPNANDQASQAARAAQASANQQAQGTNATILTSPLGDPAAASGKNINRTLLQGF